MNVFEFLALMGLGLSIPAAYKFGHTVGQDGCCPPEPQCPTTVMAPCSTCRGVVPLAPQHVTLVNCTRPELSYYAFTCPRCGADVRQPADDEVIALLLSAGVRAEHWHVPAETTEHPGGAAIGYDDVLDFVLALDDVEQEARGLR